MMPYDFEGFVVAFGAFDSFVSRFDSLRMQEVHADTRAPFSIKVWTLMCCFFAVAMFEWLRLFEFIAPRPQREHVRAIEVEL